MKIKSLLPLERIVAKVDNDFNIDQSDWIPRAAAWTIDCLSILKCAPYQRKRERCDVIDRVARCKNLTNSKSIKVYDDHGCEIDNATGEDAVSAFGCFESADNTSFYGGDKKWSDEEIAIFTNSADVRERLKVGRSCVNHNKNFVVTANNMIELNFDADFIVVEYFGVATYYSEYFNEDVPYVYDNGLLLEAISWYIMMRILQRGYKHQVFTLTGPEPVNPYIQFNKIKDNAIASVKKDLRSGKDNEGWNNFFYNSTFLPRLYYGNR